MKTPDVKLLVFVVCALFAGDAISSPARFYDQIDVRVEEYRIAAHAGQLRVVVERTKGIPDADVIHVALFGTAGMGFGETNFVLRAADGSFTVPFLMSGTTNHFRAALTLVSSNGPKHRTSLYFTVVEAGDSADVFPGLKKPREIAPDDGKGVALISTAATNEIVEAVRCTSETASLTNAGIPANISDSHDATRGVAPLGSGTFSVTGYLYYRTLDGGYAPIRYAKVEVCDSEPFPLSAVVLREGYTDSNGRYSFSGISNDDGWLENGMDVFIKCHATYWSASDKCAYVTDGNILGVSYWTESSVRGDVADGATVDFGNISITQADSGSWSIYDSAVNAYRFFLGYGWGNEKVLIKYPYGSWPNFSGFPWLPVIFYDIEIPSGWEYSPDALYHEFSHAVMYKMYGNALPMAWVRPNPHTYSSESDEAFAIMEGWAEFCAEAIYGSTSFEINLCADSVDSGDYDGEIVEGAVAEALFDIYDGGSGDDDGVPSKMDNLMYIMQTFDPGSILTVKSQWSSMGYSYYSEIQNIYYAAKIDPPPPPAAPTSPSPENGATGQDRNIDISWSNGGGATSYDVYFGTDSTPDSTESKGNQTGASYDPGTLAYSTTFYWRIDAKNAAGTTSGDVWSFTTGSAPPPPPSKAISPSPGNGVSGQDVNVDLSWANGGGATSYDVYFGTDSTPDSTESKGNQTGTSYDPGPLAYSTTYYWRIDAKNAVGTTSGDVWSFTTGSAPPSPPSKATSPSPANGVTGQDLNVDVSWLNGGGATSYDVYFGTDSTPDSTESKGNQTGASYDPGTLAYSTTYYWRIDAKNAAGTTAGDVWSFTTGSAPPSPPSKATSPNPANGATGVDVNADLSWANGGGATSYDVYFETDSTPDSTESKGNQTGASYDPGTLAYSTTYYWRIDAKNAAGTTAGDVWSFTTAPLPPPSGVSASDGTYSDKVAVSWNASSGATAYEVWRHTANSSGSASKIADPTGTSYDDTAAVAGTTYYYWVKAKNAGGTSGFSSSDSGYRQSTPSDVLPGSGGMLRILSSGASRFIAFKSDGSVVWSNSSVGSTGRIQISSSINPQWTDVRIFSYTGSVMSTHLGTNP